ncbi:hypothetical protein [Paraburkholderia tropica]|uniref:hypothetical protein n=2 Tax=Bacteria TaxID=2 RepID=UPI002AB6EA58|nr:hypothetical protein [Paraburkholderia tropica]
MKHRIAPSVLLGLLFFPAMQSAIAQAPLDIALGAPAGFIASDIHAGGDGRYCISGSVVDDTGPSESAYVLLVDTTHRQVLWRASIPHGHNTVGNTATRCIGDGKAWYAVTEEHTNRAESLNQTKVIINKLSSQGVLLKQQAINAGFDEWSYLLDANAGGVAVAGGTSATLERGGSFGTWVARFDTDLQPTQTVKLDNGAFWTDTRAQLDGNHLLLSGEFLPNKGPQAGGRDAYATAKIDLASRKYAWANYALPDNTRSANAVFSTDGTTYMVGFTPNDLAVAKVDRTGKTLSAFTVKKPLCGADALTLSGSTLKAIGTACDGDAPAIASIDLASKAATAARALGGDVSASTFDGDVWVGIVKTKAHDQFFRRSAQ